MSKYLGEAGTKVLIEKIKENQAGSSGSDIVMFDLGTIDLSKYYFEDNNPGNFAFYSDSNKTKQLIAIIEDLKSNPKPVFVYGKLIYRDMPSAVFQFASPARLDCFPEQLRDQLIFSTLHNEEFIIWHNPIGSAKDYLYIELLRGGAQIFPPVGD